MPGQLFLPLVGGGVPPKSFLISFTPSDSRGQSQEKVPLTQPVIDLVRGCDSLGARAACLAGLATGMGTFRSLRNDVCCTC